MRRSCFVAWGLLLCGGPLLAQQPEPESPASAAEREHGELLLRRHAERSQKVKLLVADYVQRRTTRLSKRPLVSRGVFLFVKQPGCVVFRQSKPRASLVRLTSTRYEVFRPRRKQLERFVLDGPAMSEGLFAALGGDAERLLRDFDVSGCRPVGEPGQPTGQLLQVRLLPKTEAVRKQLRELLVTLHDKRAQLTAIAYRDRAGDLIEIELSAVRVDPEDAPSVDFEVPVGTKIIEHAARSAGHDGR